MSSYHRHSQRQNAQLPWALCFGPVVLSKAFLSWWSPGLCLIIFCPPYFWSPGYLNMLILHWSLHFSLLQRALLTTISQWNLRLVNFLPSFYASHVGIGGQVLYWAVRLFLCHNIIPPAMQGKLPFALLQHYLMFYNNKSLTYLMRICGIRNICQEAW